MTTQLQIVGTQAGQNPLDGTNNVYIYGGNDSLEFMLPNNPDSGSGTWTIGGGSAMETIVDNTSKNNVLVSGAGGGWFIGGTGNDEFLIAEAPSNQMAWSEIINFHAGETIDFGGMFTDGWLLSVQNKDNGATGYSGLTLEATHGGATELVTLFGISVSQASHIHIAQGTGSHPGDYMVTYT